MATKNKDKIYDVAIIGAGPAGMTSAIYSSRYNLKTIIFDPQSGGTANWAHEVENYPGFEKIEGVELMSKFRKQAEKTGTEFIDDTIKDIIREKDYFIVKTETRETEKISGPQKSKGFLREKIFNAKTIILASGTQKRKLNIPTEERYVGKGISYCATCDGPLFKDKIACVIGGSNAAAMSALLLAEYCKKIYFIYRGKESELKADPIRIAQMKKNKKISFIFETEIKEIKGNVFVESIALRNGNEIKTDGVFVEIGSIPSTYLAQKLGLNLSNQGYIITNNEMETNIPGVFACGDIIEKKLRQIITAASDGAIAAYGAYLYIKNK